MVTFICTGNWYRSRFAAAYTRYRGIRSQSRGLDIARLKTEPVNWTPVFDNTQMSRPAYRYLVSLGVSHEIIAQEEEPQQFTTQDWIDSSICIALYHKEHYPLLVNNKETNKIATRIMYWDIKDMPKTPEQKGYHDNLGGWKPEYALAQIKDKIDKLFT